MNAVAGRGFGGAGAGDDVVGDAAIVRRREIDPEEHALEAIVSDRTTACLRDLERGPILDEARADVPEDEAAHGDVVGGDRHDLV